MMKRLLLLIALFWAAPVMAYPHFIGHGYPSCLNCHYNPLGNGPLTDYGRAVGADGISSGMFYPKAWSEEKITSLSGFLFKPPINDHIRAQANYRGLYLVTGPGTSTEQKTWINMQAGAQVILQFLKSNRLTFVGDLGYAPKPRQMPAGEEYKPLRSREYYVGYRIQPEIGVYAGFMDKAYGIRVAEHIAFSRVLTQNTMNDQTHGVMVHVLTGPWEGAIHGFMGNLAQSEDLRQKGVSLMVERALFEAHRVGLSFQRSSNRYLSLTSYALHSRLDLLDGSALLIEVGQSQFSSETGRGNQLARYGLLQTYLRPVRGLYLVANIEYLKSDVASPGSTMRWGPGAQFFPIQKLELRMDAYSSRNFNPGASTADSWMLMFQTHLWL